MDKRELYRIFRDAFSNWIRGNATIRAAALTFFIILPLPTLLLIISAFFGVFFGEAQANQILVQQISAVAGPAVTALFSQLIESTASPFTSAWTTFVVVGFSVAGAMGAFVVLRDSLNSIWGVRLPVGQPLWKRVRRMVLPFFVVSVLGLVVIVWTALAGGLFNAIEYFSVNTILTFVALGVAQVASSFGIAVLLLAITYKLLPQVKVHWRDVALAAIVTGAAFTVANYIFGTYIQVFVVTTVAGAAGALLIILLWIFVLNQIVLFGAEVSKVYAVRFGGYRERVLPESVGRLVEPFQRAGELFEWVTKGEVDYAEPETEDNKRMRERAGESGSEKKQGSRKASEDEK